MGRRIEEMKFDDVTGKAVLTRRNVVTKAYYKAVKCKFCGDWESIVQYGKTASGTQRYLCRQCKRTFLDNRASLAKSALNQAEEFSAAFFTYKKEDR